MKRLLIVLVLLCLITPVVMAAGTYEFTSDANGDGTAVRQDTGQEYTLTRNGAGTDDKDYTGGLGYTWTRRWTDDTHLYNMQRGVFCFNTASLTDTDTVDSVRFSLYGYSKGNDIGSPDYGITGFFPADPSALVYGDFNKVLNTAEYSDARIAYASYTDSGRNNWTGNAAFIANVSKTGYTNLSVRDSWDLANSPTGISGANYAYTFIRFRTSEDATPGNRPILRVVTSAGGSGGDTTPPASITDLANETTCNSVNFTWTNPGGDQNETVIWKDDALYKNVSNTTTFELFTGLDGWKAYKFSSKTKDAAGNLNETWQNMTAQTSPICIIEGILRNWFWRTPARLMT